MREKEKARPSVAALGRATETAELEQAAIPCAHHTTVPAERQFRVSDFLEQGRENAVPLRILKALLHLDGRTLRQLIQHERLQGTPILSSSVAGTGGYYLAATPAEVHHFTRSMRARAHEIMRVAEAVEKATGCDEV